MYAVSLLAVLLSAATAPVRAQECAPPDLLSAVPADGAVAVPLDASFRARYAPTAVHRGEIVVLQPEGGAEQEIPAFYEAAESTLIASPTEPLPPRTRHVLRWPSLSSADGTTSGEGRVLTFSTGADVDGATPGFDGVQSMAWDVERDRDPCVDSRVERYVFDLYVGEARDDTGPGTLEALVFQTEGPRMDPGDPPRLIETAEMPSLGAALSVRLPREESLGRVCFTVVARDLTGGVSPAPEHRCVETTHPPFFEGCSASGSSAWPSWLVILFWVVLTRRARARRPPS